MGDSAGAGLALITAQQTSARETLAGLTLMAPWLDLIMANPEIDEVEPRDPWLSRPPCARWPPPGLVTFRWTIRG